MTNMGLVERNTFEIISLVDAESVYLDVSVTGQSKEVQLSPIVNYSTGSISRISTTVGSVITTNSS